MIEIISEEIDRVTDNVIEYLLANKIKFNRKNVEDFTKCSVRINNLKDRKKDTIWHRRAKLNLLPHEIRNSPILSYLKREEDPVIKAIEKMHFLTKPENFVGGYFEEEQHNKVLDLFLAKKFGLLIPETLVTTNKKDLKEFKEQHKKIITKPIKYPFFLHTQECNYNGNGTFVVSENDIRNLNDYFFISVFQSYIEKKYEVRTFFFKDAFYSMAIFSQKDIHTQVDFRNYNKNNPNRNVPFQLPKSIFNKVKKLIMYKEMTSGSIDFIITPSNKFIFLEVNPQGQFHWLSENCNYNIEKSIARTLDE